MIVSCLGTGVPEPVRVYTMMGTMMEMTELRWPSDDDDDYDDDDDDDDDGLLAYCHRSYSHQVGICHYDKGLENETVKLGKVSKNNRFF